jgi:hypothetical protein
MKPELGASFEQDLPCHWWSPQGASKKPVFAPILFWRDPEPLLLPFP